MTDEEQLRRVARESTKETLGYLGFNVEEPHEVQAQVQTLRAIHEARKRGAMAFTWVMVTLLLSGLGSAVLHFFKPGGN